MWTYSRQNSYRLQAFSVGITILNQRIIWKDDIEFVTEFPCLLWHPVYRYILTYVIPLPS